MDIKYTAKIKKRVIHATTANEKRCNKEYSDITNNKYISIQLKPLENNKYNISFIGSV